MVKLGTSMVVLIKFSLQPSMQALRMVSRHLVMCLLKFTFTFDDVIRSWLENLCAITVHTLSTWCWCICARLAHVCRHIYRNNGLGELFSEWMKERTRK